MKSSTFLLVAAMMSGPVCATAAEAPPANVKAAFGNTLLTIDPDGRSRKIWLEPDGTWTGRSRRGLDLAGKWRMDGEKVCLSQSKPALPGSLCEVLPKNLQVGGPAMDDPSGKTGKLQLVRGRTSQ